MRVFSRTLIRTATALLFAAGCAACCAQTLAPVPPMGWNSWDAYGTTITEAETKANADAMVSLKGFGWQYVVVDIQWYEPEPKAHGYRVGSTFAMDANGRLLPAPNRFPSAASGEGFKALADYVHGKGLKFGIHILRGIPRQAVERNLPVLGAGVTAADIADVNSVCSWNKDMYGVDMSKPGAQAYYDSMVAQYAAWGVDFIKADDMSRPYHAAEIAALHQAIVKAGRPMVLSLSPGPAPLEQVEDLRKNAEMWRVEDDLWDSWKSVRRVYDRAEPWAPYTGDGHWPDMDMLPLGHIGIRAERGDDRLSKLTHDEQQTVMTMWAILRSPLIFGGDLPTLDAYTRSLLTNRAVLAVDQRSEHAKLVRKDGDVRVWAAEVPGSRDRYVAVLNLAEGEQAVAVPWTQLGLKRKPVRVTDLWSSRGVVVGSSLFATLPSHASLLVRVEY